MSLPTMSRVPLAMACAASVALPQVGSTGPAAERGTALHAFVTACARHGKAAALASAPEALKAECERLDVAALLTFVQPGKVHHELALAYDPVTDTARVLGEDIGREYRARGADPDREICGALDLVSVRDGDAVVVDLKTGRHRVGPWQLRAQAVAVSRAFSVNRVRVAYAYLQEDGSLLMEQLEDLDVFDLDAFAGELRAMVGRSNAARAVVESGRVPDVFEGEHCVYCPAARACPAKTAMVRAMAPDLVEISVDGTGEITREQLGAAWVRLREYERLLYTVRDAIETVARAEGVPLPDGRVLREVSTERRSIDGRKALPVLRELHGEAIANAALEPSTTQAAIKRALEAAVSTTPGRKNVSGALKVTMERLEEAGAVDVKTTKAVKECAA